MRIGILGTGDVGRTLARGFASRGHEVKIGSRDPKKLEGWLGEAGPGISTGTFSQAAAFAEVAVLATLWSGTENAVALAEPANLGGKVVLDATNPLIFHADRAPTLALGHTDSGGEQVQRWLPGAKVVKWFNIVGHGHMVDPDFPGGPPDMFLCGNDGSAKETADRLARELGWPQTIDCGAIESSRLLEPLCILWVDFGIRSKSWNHAFKLLRK